LNPSLQSERLEDNIASAPSSADQNAEGAARADLARSAVTGAKGNNPPHVEDFETRSAGYFYKSQEKSPATSENSPEIAAPIPLLTDIPAAETVQAGTGVAPAASQSEKTESEKIQPNPQSNPEEIALRSDSASNSKKEEERALGVNLAEPLPVLGALSDKKADPPKTVRAETGAVGGGGRNGGVSKIQEKADKKEQAQEVPSTPGVQLADNPNPNLFFSPGKTEPAPTQDGNEEISLKKGEAKEKAARSQKRVSTPTPAPTSRPESKSARVDRIFPANEKKSRDLGKTPLAAAAPVPSAGMAGAPAASSDSDSLRLSLQKERNMTERHEDLQVLEVPAEKASEKNAQEVTPAGENRVGKSVENPQPTPLQKRATPQMARQIISQPEADAAEVVPDKGTKNQASPEKEGRAKPVARPSAPPLPTQAGRQITEGRKRGEVAKQAVQNEAAIVADKIQEKEAPLRHSAFERADAAPVKKVTPSPVPAPAKPASSKSANLVVSVQVGTSASLDDVANLFRGNATVSQTAGSGKTLGTLTCTAPGKNQQWVLEQLRGAGFQSKDSPGAKGSYQVNQSSSSTDAGADFVFRITVTRR
ncbi:MAG TPA: hypothetical protein PLA90_04795, partial [Candidatus Sumerlaeota bacterium]|nr:hypothetical protein [Candidatus Sumerlaeota bacterium]